MKLGHNKMKLGTRFYNDHVSEISKIRIVWPWGFFLFEEITDQTFFMEYFSF